ncbi:hypothetical protein PCH_Pc18g01950 [Penicillium rubens Wisconsin 54-1255]|uniref:Uncharacterized protein n=1 Tax=Penicillium rubens (strain ATCC 28089 / DSM 1075 / NRRL 1951 / Wisconsin 54-1255) TaxID=500485 RepID=B6HCP0_PENRW|nr:hypothetical protein PCH_Pc18g01950 [Penicillium rubens Wisconsin 54-1255]
MHRLASISYTRTAKRRHLASRLPYHRARAFSPLILILRGYNYTHWHRLSQSCGKGSHQALLSRITALSIYTKVGSQRHPQLSVFATVETGVRDPRTPDSGMPTPVSKISDGLRD